MRAPSSPKRPPAYRTWLWLLLVIAAGVVAATVWGKPLLRSITSIQTAVETPAVDPPPIDTATSNASAASLPTPIPAVSVLIPLRDIATAESFDQVEVASVSVPASLAPANAISSPAELRGKVAMGPIAARSIISRLILGNPVAVLAHNTAPSSTAIDDLLAVLQTKLAELPVRLASPGIRRGARVALTRSTAPADAAPEIAEGWVLSVKDSTAIVLIPRAEQARLSTLPRSATWRAKELTD